MPYIKYAVEAINLFRNHMKYDMFQKIVYNRIHVTKKICTGIVGNSRKSCFITRNIKLRTRFSKLDTKYFNICIYAEALHFRL